MIPGLSATVLPFRDAALRAPADLAGHRRAPDHEPAGSRARVDNVVVLAHFARRQRRPKHFFTFPPDGAAA
jgi:hypothetical protein